VLIDVPVDIASAPARDATHEPYLPGYRPRERPNGRQIRRAAEAIAQARRPVLYAGGGVTNADAAEELRALAALTGAPVTTTLMALGTIPSSDPQWLGMLGMHGTRVANWAMDEADLIVAVGARFDDRVTGAIDEFARDAKIVHIDVDPSEIGKIVTAHVPVVGDAKLALAALLEAYAKLGADDRRLTEWWRRIRGWKAAHPPREPEPAAPGCVAPEFALDQLNRLLGDAIVTTDVGQHQMWAAARLGFEAPRRWITSGGLGTMGFGLPSALGAQAAAPDSTVVCVSGEGSFLMHVQELATAVEEGLPVKVLLLDNASLGMVRQQQDLFWGGRRTAVDLGSSPDWELLARAFGWSVRSIGDGDEVEDALTDTLAEPGPALLHVRIAPEANCLPMFRPGGAAREMIG
jgi:acetolactate synthase-1/2/3 large subunit